METSKTHLHPLLTAAALSVTVLSAVGVAALTGVLPHSRGSTAPVATTSPETVIEHAVSMPVPQPPDTAPVPVAKPRAKPVASARSSHTAPRTTPRPAPLPGVAGTIETVKEVEQAGDAKGVGAVAGGVAGAVIGHNFGEHNKIVTVLGSAGGALLGHQIEKTARATKHWETIVRLENGTTQTISTESEPVWHAGDRVRVLDGQVQKS